MSRAKKIIEAFKDVVGKFPGMRNAQYWTVYPYNLKDNEFVIQCETRIAKVNLNTGKSLLSANGKNLFVGLNPALGAKVVDTPKDILDQLHKLKQSAPSQSSQQLVVGEASEYDIEAVADFLANDSEESDSPQKELVSGLGLNNKQADGLIASWFKLNPKDRLALSLDNKKLFPWIENIIG
jgi:hypothetical protein